VINEAGLIENCRRSIKQSKVRFSEGVELRWGRPVYGIGPTHDYLRYGSYNAHWRVFRGNDIGNWEHWVRFEVFTAVTMKNALFWDIATQFVSQREHITSPLYSPAPVNAMQDLRSSRRWLWRMSSSGIYKPSSYHVYAIEPSRLMLCKIWGFHGGGWSVPSFEMWPTDNVGSN
jgi:hypothetical protein